MKRLSKNNETILEQRKALADSFPMDGKVRVQQFAAYLNIGVSSIWKLAKDGRIKKPQKLGARTSVWDAGYVRMLGEEGIPEAAEDGVLR